MVTSDDIALMRRALFLAERGRGTTTPNPVVGAVVLSADGVIVGQGAHRVAGGPHAEVFALDAAGERARGGTLYCTLEPCSHTGRTGPCAVRVADAGIARVVVAMTDPNPRVSGAGLSLLRSRGIVVESDVERDAAARQNAPFVTWITAHRPRITMKAAVSADGFVGAKTSRVVLTGASMDRLMHRQRAAIDAIAVGSETVLIDDPQLSVRHVYRSRPLMRVVFDRRGRVTPQARLFQTLKTGPVIMCVSEEVAASRQAEALRAIGATVLAVPGTGSLAWVVEQLARLEILDVLVEGGPTLQRAMWDAGLVDRVQWIESSTRIGSGVQAFMPARPNTARRTTRGADTLWEWDVHRAD